MAEARDVLKKYSGEPPELNARGIWDSPICPLNENQSPIPVFCESDDSNLAVDHHMFAQVLLETENKCVAYENTITANIANAQKKLLELTSTDTISPGRKLEIIDETAHASNRLLEVSRNKIWKLVKSQVNYPDKSVLAGQEVVASLLKENIDKYESALNILAAVLSEVRDLDVKFELDIDDEDCVIINWLFEEGSYEWTVICDSSPWPMIKVYEYSSGIFENDKETCVRTLHNFTSLLQRFRVALQRRSEQVQSR